MTGKLGLKVQQAQGVWDGGKSVSSTGLRGMTAGPRDGAEAPEEAAMRGRREEGDSSGAGLQGSQCV